MRRVQLLILALGLALAGQADAQTQAALRSGDLVRVRSSVASGRYTVIDVHDTAMTLRADPAGSTITVPLASVGRLEVHRGFRSRGQGALRGAGYGLVIGAGIGAIGGLASGDDEGSFISFTAEEKAAVLAVLGGGIGIVAGALVGQASPGDRWERVSDLRALHVEPTAGGGLAIGFAGRF